MALLSKGCEHLAECQRIGRISGFTSMEGTGRRDENHGLLRQDPRLTLGKQWKYEKQDTRKVGSASSAANTCRQNILRSR